jgi:nucleoside-diphosphate kinase
MAAPHAVSGKSRRRIMTAGGQKAAIDWDRWSVVLIKPDCLRRNLVGAVLLWLTREVQIIAQTSPVVTEEQIMPHYADMLPRSQELGRDVACELRRIFVGQQVTAVLVHGSCGTPARVRAMLGPTIDPGPHTIRGTYGIDTIAAAQAQGRLLDNLIHSSDTAADVERDLLLWFGPNAAQLLHQTAPAFVGGNP